ncbi:pygopus homolog 1 isoform X2 [Erinaceus europaeus]|uniref:Pygopus homolog 1 isoform X2 n=1 Tax=Erinaceus europaeus TaxID=9365 RepID=A0ABM3WC64_ERIEU|nr:pygopus homolog 1 isoform X2 [Erinaceus europaeus]
MSAEQDKEPPPLRRGRGGDGGLDGLGGPGVQLGSPDKKKRKASTQGPSFPPLSEYAPPPNPNSDHLVAANPFDDNYNTVSYKPLPPASPYLGPGYPGFGGYGAFRMAPHGPPRMSSPYCGPYALRSQPAPFPPSAMGLGFSRPHALDFGPPENAGFGSPPYGSAPAQHFRQSPADSFGQVAPQTPGQVAPQTPGQVAPQTPGQVPPQTPGQVAPQTPGQVPPQTPGQVPPQVPPQTPRQVSAPEPAPSFVPGNNATFASPLEPSPSFVSPAHTLGQARAPPAKTPTPNPSAQPPHPAGEDAANPGGPEGKSAARSSVAGPEATGTGTGCANGTQNQPRRPRGPAEPGGSDKGGKGPPPPGRHGPRPAAPVFPCGICTHEVHDDQDAILCEASCQKWFHRVCTGMTETAYGLLTAEAAAVWGCDACMADKSAQLLRTREAFGPPAVSGDA